MTATAQSTTTRMQYLLDEGDLFWFTRNPDQTTRRRFHFRGEAITGEAKPMRHVVVSLDADGRLVRRFLVETAGDA